MAVAKFNHQILNPTTLLYIWYRIFLPHTENYEMGEQVLNGLLHLVNDLKLKKFFVNAKILET